MWLINVRTRLLEEYVGSNVPSYAILSHTWDEDEVSFQQYNSGDFKGRRGYNKIHMTCVTAEEEGLSYAWVDTCCINKSSSAELSEAINSMFRWYQRSTACYVYLADLPKGANWREELPKCRWFTRGWTLQELIAPQSLTFFDSTWRTRPAVQTSILLDDLEKELSAITRIDVDLLTKERPLSYYSVAQKMSWAAQRETTRIEDRAYSLLGLFGLHMPLLYGEEDRAFQRLQEAIIHSTADLSIFAWKFPAEKDRLSTVLDPYERKCVESKTVRGQKVIFVIGVLARSPAEFHFCGSYERIADVVVQEFSTSNIGIRTRVQMDSVYTAEDRSAYALVLPLNCASAGQPLGLRLRQVGPGQYLRQDPWSLVDNPVSMGMTYPAVERKLLTNIPADCYWSDVRVAPSQDTVAELRRHVLRLIPDDDLLMSNPWPVDYYDHEDELFFDSRSFGKDFRTIDVTWRLPLTTARGDQRKSNITQSVELKCTIVTLGWSETDLHGPGQFSIVQSDTITNCLSLIKKDVMDLDLSLDELIDELAAQKIPRTLSVHRLIPGTNWTAVLAIDVQKLENQSMSSKDCHDLKIMGTICETEGTPTVVKLDWQMDSASSGAAPGKAATAWG